MKVINEPCKPKPKKFILSAGINYFSYDNRSIWGDGDEDTIKYLNKISIKGNWLNLASGDGRYCDILLKKVNKLTCVDIDDGALSKLWRLTPDPLKSKLVCKKINIISHFPFKDKSFDGIFCTGVLHLFPKKILINQILNECKRVIKPNGRIIIDFATDVIRRYPSGKLHYIYSKEPKYKSDEAIRFIKNQFNKSQIIINKSEVYDDLTNVPGAGYNFYCKFLIVDILFKNY